MSATVHAVITSKNPVWPELDSDDCRELDSEELDSEELDSEESDSEELDSEVDSEEESDRLALEVARQKRMREHEEYLEKQRQAHEEYLQKMREDRERHEKEMLEHKERRKREMLLFEEQLKQMEERSQKRWDDTMTKVKEILASAIARRNGHQ
jgi:hypothetical protein